MGGHQLGLCDFARSSRFVLSQPREESVAVLTQPPCGRHSSHLPRPRGYQSTVSHSCSRFQKRAGPLVGHPAPTGGLSVRPLSSPSPHITSSVQVTPTQPPCSLPGGVGGPGHTRGQ